MTAMPPHSKSSGRCRKKEALSAFEKVQRIFLNRCRRALLVALLENNVATMDDVRTAVVIPSDINPKCLGAVPGALVRSGIIAASGYAPTTRREGNCRTLRVWSLADADAARRWLALHPDHPYPEVAQPAPVIRKTLFEL